MKKNENVRQFVLTLNGSKELKYVIGKIEIDESKIDINQLTNGFHQGLFEILPSLVRHSKKSDFEICEFGLFVKVKK